MCLVDLYGSLPWSVIFNSALISPYYIFFALLRDRITTLFRPSLSELLSRFTSELGNHQHFLKGRCEWKCSREAWQPMGLLHFQSTTLSGGAPPPPRNSDTYTSCQLVFLSMGFNAEYFVPGVCPTALATSGSAPFPRASYCV